MQDIVIIMKRQTLSGEKIVNHVSNKVPYLQYIDTKLSSKKRMKAKGFKIVFTNDAI